MKRILSSAMCAIVCLLLIATPAIAAETPDRIVDNADLLTGIQESLLEQLAQEVSSKLNCDVVIVTTSSLGKKAPEAYASEYFENHGYGVGEEHSGILFLLSSENGEWTIGTYGKATKVLSEDKKNNIFASITDFLAEEKFYKAFETFLKSVESSKRLDDMQLFLLVLVSPLPILLIAGGAICAVTDITEKNSEHTKKENAKV